MTNVLTFSVWGWDISTIQNVAIRPSELQLALPVLMFWRNSCTEQICQRFDLYRRDVSLREYREMNKQELI
jgi:hypothetical protein